MNSIETAIGWALLHLIWQGTIVAALLAATLFLLGRRSAVARYYAACIALLLLVVLPIVTASRSSGTLPFPSSSRWVAFAGAHMREIVAAWLLGVALLSLRLAGGWLRARRLATRGTKPSPAWQRIVDRIAASMSLRRTVRLLESAAVEVPTVIGWLRPVVLLPVAALSGLAPEQVEMVLAHELAHIRRHDFLVNLLQAIVETLLFYHPAVWWISRQVRIERENCCDDLAISVCGSRIRYARALTRLEELRVDAAPPLLAANGASLVERVRRLTARHNESPIRISAYATAGVLSVAVLALITAPALPLFAKAPAPPAPAMVKVVVMPIVPAPVKPMIIPVAHHTRAHKHAHPRMKLASARDVDRDAANLRMPRLIVIQDQQVVRVSLRSDGTFIIETVQPIRVGDLMPRIDKF